MNVINAILGLGGKVTEAVMGKFWPDKSGAREAQSRINEQEVGGAPASLLRLWRGFLGWVLAMVFAWEVVGRPTILTYWPETVLPPSVLGEISSLLLGMLGLGF